MLLTALVILHHVAVTYGAPGNWYYHEKTSSPTSALVLTVVVSVNQAFFMGFFFLLSAYFVPAAYNKRGFARFLADRITRLGVPLLFYSLVLSPLLSYIPYDSGGHAVSYPQYLGGFDSWVDFGVLWFVAALLLFNISYAIYRKVGGRMPTRMPMPGATLVILIALVVGVLSFCVRWVFPVGWVLKPVGFQLGHFCQYMVLFIAGLVGADNKWLDNIRELVARRLLKIAMVLVVAGFPLLVVLQRLLVFPASQFAGGGHWPSLLYACWEQLLGFCMIVAFLYIGRERLNKQYKWSSAFARSTFAVYIFHPLFVILLSVALSGWSADPGWKFLVVTPAAILSSFGFGLLLVRIPIINRIL